MSTIKEFHDLLDSCSEIDLFQFKHIIPELLPMEQTKQEPKHHAEGDVLTHTQMSMQEVFPLLKEVSNSEHRKILYLATLLHDIGKPSTTSIHPKKGTIIAYGHDKAGVPIAKDFLRKYFPEYSFKTREQILSLIESHMKPRMMMKDGTTDAKLKTLSMSVNTHLLYLLSVADTLGRKAENMGGLDSLDKFKSECERLDIWGKMYVIPGSQWQSNQGYSLARWNILMHNASETKETMDRAEDVMMNSVPRFQLLIMVGAPGSGKSTMAESLLKQAKGEAKIICMDSKRLELCGTEEDMSKNQEVFNACFKELVSCMRNKQSVIWDATSSTRKGRKRLWEVARQHGAVTGGVYFDLPFSTLVERNSKRTRQVPEAVIRKFYNQQESLHPYEVDQLFIVES